MLRGEPPRLRRPADGPYCLGGPAHAGSARCPRRIERCFGQGGAAAQDQLPDLPGADSDRTGRGNGEAARRNAGRRENHAAGAGEVLRFAERRAEGALQLVALVLPPAGVIPACTAAHSPYSPRRFSMAVIAATYAASHLVAEMRVLGCSPAHRSGPSALPTTPGGGPAAPATALCRRATPKSARGKRSCSPLRAGSIPRSS